MVWSLNEACLAQSPQQRDLNRIFAQDQPAPPKRHAAASGRRSNAGSSVLFTRRAQKCLRLHVGEIRFSYGDHCGEFGRRRPVAREAVT